VFSEGGSAVSPAGRLLPHIVGVLAFTLSAWATQAQDFETNIVTGASTGTYIEVGRDISRAMASCGYNLNVRESAGSTENFEAVRTRRHTQFGIVQSDVLAYFDTFFSGDAAYEQAIAGMRIAFPLYDEEVHLLASRDITSMADLVGKRVAIGTVKSGTFITSSLLLRRLGIESSVLSEELDPKIAMARLLNDQIDAMFYVAGAPAALFRTHPIDADRFHLVPTDTPGLDTVYSRGEIPAGTYGFQGETVPVASVKAVLMTYEYDPARNAYHRASCKAVSDVAYVILTRFSDLQQNGHEKWQQVSLTDLPPGWDVSTCVTTGIAADYEFVCNAATGPVADGVNRNDDFKNRVCDVVEC
jgi:TRAP transporter TAXI family solute receptor